MYFTADTAVARVSRTGGTVAIVHIHDDGLAPKFITSDDTHVYWTASDGSTGAVWQAEK